MKGAAENSIMGLDISSSLRETDPIRRMRSRTYVPTFSFVKTSDIAPPETDKKALPPKPVRKRNMRCTAILLAKATGKLSTVRVVRL